MSIQTHGRTATATVRTAPEGDGAAPVAYSIQVSTAPEDIRAAQRLRHEVFTTEPGFAVSVSPDGLDTDRFDEFCEHLLVRDDASGDVVGCYRMLSPKGAHAAGGYYTSTEFAMESFGTVADELVEMGRACVRADHRNGAVLSMMWAGLLRYIWLGGYRYATGCVSVPMQLGGPETRGVDVRGIRDHVVARHRADDAFTVTPHNPVPGIDEVPPPARPRIPPLLQGYLRLGAAVCGEPGYDPEFDVADFVILMDRERLNTRYLDRLQSAAGITDLRMAPPGEN